MITVLLMNNNHMNNELRTNISKREGVLQFTKITLRSLYHTFAAVLGAESAEFEYEMVSASLLGRLFRLGLLFLVLMVGAMYNVSASFLIQIQRKHLPWADDIRRTETSTRAFNKPSQRL